MADSVGRGGVVAARRRLLMAARERVHRTQSAQMARHRGAHGCVRR